MIYERRYRLSVIEQKVEYVSGSAPANLKQGYYSAWKVPPVDSSLAGLPTSVSTQVSAQEALQSGNNAKTITSGGDSVLISDLHITAEINSKSGDGEAAKSVIRIYNASAATRAKLEKKNAYIILEAGYGDDIGIVFVGTSQRAFSRKQGTEYVTEINCIDSNVQLKTSRVSFSWPVNTKYSKIFEDVAGAMREQGIATGFIETKAKNLPSLPSPDDTVAKGGFSYQGTTTQLLDNLCSQFSYHWSISLNELYIHPRTFKSFTVQYAFSSDLIKSIEPQSDSTQETPNVEVPARYRLETFLDHRIKIGHLVNIRDGNYKGRYKVISVDTRLSYLDGGPWSSEIILETA